MGKKTFIISSLLLVVSLIFFELTNTDFYLQDKLYDFVIHSWKFRDPTEIYNLIFYKLIKIPIYIIALYVLIKVIIGIRTKTLIKNYRPHLIILLSLIIIPGGIATVGKKSINVQCPYDIPRYGGQIPYVKLFQSYPHNPNRTDGKWPPGNCFPAGHASGGFALLSLFFLARNKKEKWWAIFFSLGMGLMMSAYQMLRGAHYLSHQWITFLIALIIISALNLIIKKEYNHEPKNDSTTSSQK